MEAPIGGIVTPKQVIFTAGENGIVAISVELKIYNRGQVML
jgi:hypothetical protein